MKIKKLRLKNNIFTFKQSWGFRYKQSRPPKKSLERPSALIIEIIRGAIASLCLSIVCTYTVAVPDKMAKEQS